VVWVIPPKYVPFTNSLKKTPTAISSPRNFYSLLLEIPPHFIQPPPPFLERKTMFYLRDFLTIGKYINLAPIGSPFPSEFIRSKSDITYRWLTAFHKVNEWFNFYAPSTESAGMVWDGILFPNFGF
jgi:hypothetical protein